MSPIKREVQIGDCRLILGDCLEILPTLGKVDAVVTDPPFGVRSDEWDDMSAEEFSRFSMQWLSIIPTLTDEVLIFGYVNSSVHKLCEMLFPRVRPIIWRKPPGSQLNGAHERGRWFSYEAIFHCYRIEDEGGDVARLITEARKRAELTRSGVDVLVRGKKTGLCYRWEEGACLPTLEQVETLKKFLQLGPQFDVALDREYLLRTEPAERFDVLSHRTVTAGRHPCEKPIPLMHDLIAGLDSTGTVLDPFCGSGSTGIAALKLARPFIGVERDPAYFDIACDRIRKAYAQPDLFIEIQRPEGKQESLFNGASA